MAGKSTSRVSVVLMCVGVATVFAYLFQVEIQKSTDFRRYHLKEQQKPFDALSDLEEFGSMSREYDEDCTICIKKEPGKFHLVTSFFPVTNRHFGKDFDEKFVDEFMSDEAFYVFVNKRVLELMDVLQTNLNHELITAVHVILNHPSAILTILQHKLQNMEKLVFHPMKCIGKEIKYSDVLTYIHSHLLNIPVIFANQDIYIGEGFEKIDSKKLKKKKIAYALSRVGRKERYCDMPSSCLPGNTYQGSHDSYVFVLTHVLSKRALKALNMKLDDYGAENVLIDTMKKWLGMKVLNPCYQLKTYHVHCIDFHNKNRIRVNRKKNTGVATFSDQLE